MKKRNILKKNVRATERKENGETLLKKAIESGKKRCG